MRPGPLGTDLEQRGAIIDRLRATLRTRHYSPRTEKAYVGWASRFLAFCEPAKVRWTRPMSRASSRTSPRESE